MNRSVEFNSEYIDYKDDILSLIENFSSSNGHTIKDHRNIIKKFKLGDFEINIKSFGVPPMFNAFIYSFFRLTNVMSASELGSREPLTGYIPKIFAVFALVRFAN